MHSESPSLAEVLSAALPHGHSFKYHHVSSPAASCPALYAPPPGHKPEKTTCESHLLNVSISPSKHFKQDTVAIFAIEVYIYSTRKLTTLFVSKADSTGWISLLDLPKGFSSIVKTLSSTFLSYLVRNRHRPDRRLVLSLFARAQSQYLYPGSDENDKKHILDDRQLVKWWCRTLDPVLREYQGEETVPQDNVDAASSVDKDIEATDSPPTIRTKSFLIVPGHDAYETAAFFPPSARTDPPTAKRWHSGHPLREIASQPNAPPRCLVPHFPDDPKSRFLLDLDEEIKDAPPPPRSHAPSSQSSSSQNASAALSNPQESPSKRGKGQWKSIKTLEQFWDMMAFRQECSSGRLVGFLWVVFTPETLHDHDLHSSASTRPALQLQPFAHPKLTASDTSSTTTPIPVPAKQATQLTKHRKPKSKPHSTRKPKLTASTRPRLKRLRGRLTGPIVARAPRIKQTPSLPTNPDGTTSTSTLHPGTLVLAPKAYARVHEVLVRLDFATADLARASTAKWAREAGIVAGRGAGDEDWGVVVTGRAARVLDSGASTLQRGDGGAAVNVMVGVKRKARDEGAAVDRAGVNVLGMGLLRKKPKGDATAAAATAASGDAGVQSVDVNMLGAGLVRKKVKT